MTHSSTSIGVAHGDTPLKRTLGFADLVAYGLAYIALIAPLTSLGFVWGASGGMIAASYLIGAICMYFTAQSYATMSRVIPTAGSVYGFARKSLGNRLGFIAGWVILMDYLLIPALVFTLMSVGMELLIPEISRGAWICIVAFITLGINWFGIKITSRVSAFAVIGQVVIVAVVMYLAITALQGGAGNGALTAKPFFGDSGIPWGQVFSGASIAVMAFLGFDAISTLSEETRDPSDKGLIGRAIMTVLVVAGLLFVLIAWVIGNLMPAIDMQDPATAIFELLGQTTGPWAPAALAWSLAIVVGFTNTLPMMAGVSRVLFAMGRDRQLPAILGTVHAGTGVPRGSLLASTAISTAVALSLRDQIDVLASLVSLGALAGFIMLHLSVMAYFKNAAERSWFFHMLVPALGLLVVFAVLSGMHAMALGVGCAWLFVGLLYGAYLNRQGRVVISV
ncbi:amino acid transporter [Hydrogenophaga palleronii]|uniref:Amino acid transporter n=1 Tax=Hydrogenophaga palleronii TaxID=65655 RepID=A0ABU1WRJ1_9BURK|nr:APC family permease [Hydrogenophaga palleronii]MDR7151917.1 amino acid transporter [Hydrogenophaga palleronii]